MESVKTSATWPIVDYSRYRVAEAIVERFRAGDTAEELGEDFGIGAYGVERVVAAFDRRGMHRPTRGWR